MISFGLDLPLKDLFSCSDTLILLYGDSSKKVIDDSNSFIVIIINYTFDFRIF